MENYPPYIVTDKVLNYVSRIMKKVGEANYFESLNKYPNLRIKSRIKSIHSSLAIENNQLSLFDVEDVINGKIVVGEQKDIQEVKNAYEAYEQIDKVDPYSLDDLKKVQGILTFLLEKDAGKFRNHGEAVYDGDIKIFVAPPHKLVPSLMQKLFEWMDKNKDIINPLILSSVFHYEFLFIHPFSDGNGRTARIWQTVILAHWEKIFAYLPIESMIKKNQNKYYKIIDNCNKNGNFTEFIEFMLKMINDTIDEVIISKQIKQNEKISLSKSEIEVIKCIKRNKLIGAKEIIKETELSDSTVRRTLKNLLKKEKIVSESESINSPNRRYKMTE